MLDESKRQSLSLRHLIVWGLVGANLIFCVSSSFLMFRSRQHAEQLAENLTQNVAKALELNIAKSISAVDLVLQSVVDELEAQLAAKGVDERAATALLTKLEKRVPAIEAIRVSRSDGLVILGKGVNRVDRASWVDRADFKIHQSNADSGLQVSEVRMGRVANRYIVGISRRYNLPNGDFAGTVSAPIAVEHFTKLLSQFDVGPKGTLILRDAKQRLITRVPPLPDNPAGEVGSTIMSADLRRAFEAGQLFATGATSLSPDGYRRVFTYQRLTDVPMVAIVATADDDYLVSWKAELYQMLGAIGGFVLVSVLLGGITLRLLRRGERDSERIRDGHNFVRSILDSLSDHVVVIDANGTITAVNASWRRFATENGASELAPIAVGTNYLDVCSAAKGSAENKDALAVLEGIRAVLSGQRTEYRLEYPCHSPQEQRWFILQVLPMAVGRSGAVLIHHDVSERHIAEARIKASEERFHLLFETSVDGILLTAPDGQVFAANRAACNLLQRTEEEIVKAGRSGVVDENDPRITLALEERRVTGKTGREGVFIRKDGTKFPCDISSSIYQDSEGNTRSSVVFRDISERRRIENALRESEARMSAVFQSSPIGIAISALATGKVLEVNDACLRLFGHTRDKVLGRTVAELGTYVQPEQREKMVQLLNQDGAVHGLQLDYRTRDGKLGVLELSGRVVHMMGEQCLLSMLSDVTERKLAEVKIYELAFHDALTHLPNRRLLSDRLQQALAASKRSGLHGAVMFIDLDNFKPLNDTHGHEVGDLLLVEASHRLTDCMREVDTVARVGGDEFVVVLSELGASLAECTAQTTVIAEKILQRLALPYRLTFIHGAQADTVVEHRCTACIGVTTYSGNEASYKDILKLADAAMYRAKNDGRNVIRFSDSSA
jgi:diguanylate cyclase (GGDEF)-like protein/PAS domain S-box-containing protein